MQVQGQNFCIKSNGWTNASEASSAILCSSRCGRRLMLNRCRVVEARVHHGSLHAGVLAKCTILLWEELALLVHATILLCMRAVRRWLGCRSCLGTFRLLMSISSVTFLLLSLFSSLRVGLWCGSWRWEHWLVVAIAHGWMELGVVRWARISPGSGSLRVVAMRPIAAETTKALPSPVLVVRSKSERSNPLGTKRTEVRGVMMSQIRVSTSDHGWPLKSHWKIAQSSRGAILDLQRKVLLSPLGQ